MRVQRNNQLLRELEGGPADMADGHLVGNAYDQGTGDTDTFMSR